MDKAINEFIQIYIESSAIEEVIYSNKTKKWTVKYNYDIEDDEFNSIDDMIDFFEADQYGNDGSHEINEDDNM